MHVNRKHAFKFQTTENLPLLNGNLSYTH